MNEGVRKGEWYEFPLPKGIVERPGSDGATTDTSVQDRSVADAPTNKASTADLQAADAPAQEVSSADPWSADDFAEGVRRLAELWNLPASFLQKLAARDGIRFRAGKVGLRLFPRERDDYAPEWLELEVLFEDDFCLVVNKPAGVPVHPSAPGQTGTLANAVKWHYETTDQDCKIRHIHRLDADTTGALLYAKNEFAQRRLDDAMRRKAIIRRYAAVVQGRVRPARGTIALPIGRDRHRAGRRRVSRTGVPAVTHYETAESFPGATLLSLQLETGRTHQIRVHLSAVGHPLFGDTLYGGPQKGIGRQALHAESLVFPHPWTGEPITVKAPFPPDITALLARLRAGGRRKTEP